MTALSLVDQNVASCGRSIQYYTVNFSTFAAIPGLIPQIEVTYTVCRVYVLVKSMSLVVWYTTLWLEAMCLSHAEIHWVHS